MESDKQVLLELSQKWRKSNPEYDGGVVLVWQMSVYGWKNRLRDPQDEQPGAFAIDDAGNVFVAEGGDSHSGAHRWTAHYFVGP